MTTTTLSTVPTFPIIFVPHARDIKWTECSEGLHPDCAHCEESCNAAGNFATAFIERSVGGFYRAEA